MKRKKIHKILIAGLLLAGSTEIAMASKGFTPTLETIHEKNGTKKQAPNNSHRDTQEAPSPGEIIAGSHPHEARAVNSQSHFDSAEKPKLEPSEGINLTDIVDNPQTANESKNIDLSNASAENNVTAQEQTPATNQSPEYKQIYDSYKTELEQSANKLSSNKQLIAEEIKKQIAQLNKDTTVSHINNEKRIKIKNKIQALRDIQTEYDLQKTENLSSSPSSPKQALPFVLSEKQIQQRNQSSQQNKDLQLAGGTDVILPTKLQPTPAPEQLVKSNEASSENAVQSQTSKFPTLHEAKPLAEPETSQAKSMPDTAAASKSPIEQQTEKTTNSITSPSNSKKNSLTKATPATIRMDNRSPIIKIANYSAREFKKPESPEVLDIITNNTNKAVIDRQLQDLLLKNRDNKNIDKMILDIKRLPENSLELSSLESEITTIKSIKGPTAFQKLVKQRAEAVTWYSSNKRDNVDTLIKLYDTAIAQLKKQNQNILHEAKPLAKNTNIKPETSQAKSMPDTSTNHINQLEKIELSMPQIEDQVQLSINEIINDPSLTPEAKSDKIAKLQNDYGSHFANLYNNNHPIRVWYENQIKPLYEKKITSLATANGRIEQLKKDISILQTEGIKALNIYTALQEDIENDPHSSLRIDNRKNEAREAYNQYTSIILKILWKRGAVTAKTISQTFSNFFKAAKIKFKAAKIKVPEKQVNDNDMVVDALSDLPGASATPEQQAHWFTRVSNMITDTIFGTREQQLAKTLSQNYQNEAQNIISRGDEKTPDNIKKMINGIIKEVDSTLSESDKKNLLDSILQRDLIQKKSVPLAFHETYKSLWENTNEWSIHSGGFDPAKFNAWMTKTVKLIKDKSQTASPALNTSQATV